MKHGPALHSSQACRLQATPTRKILEVEQQVQATTGYIGSLVAAQEGESSGRIWILGAHLQKQSRCRPANLPLPKATHQGAIDADGQLGASLLPSCSHARTGLKGYGESTLVFMIYYAQGLMGNIKKFQQLKLVRTC